ncbi:MAG: FAD-binding protein [Firmicutes bacterium]|nr:FAD-binding protein [Bacillota bacterium]
MTDTYKNVLETDVLVIGSEGAGARAAIEVAKNNMKVLVATKGVFTKCGATLTADMDIDVPSKAAKEVFGMDGGNPEDDELNMMRDMFMEGKYMNNEEVVWTHCSNAAKYVKELVDWGMRLDGLIQSPGHRFPRGLISTGRSMMTALKREVKRHKIDFAENTMITNLLTKDGKAVGAVGIDISTGDFLVFKAKAVVLATGGAMRIYPRTTAPEELTGEGMIMAFKAGAELVDMEFPLFLPACLVWPKSMLGVDLSYISSTVLGGWWLNKYGERFISKWDPKRMEHGTTRDIASVAQMIEILEGRGGPHGGIFVSYKHLPDELLDWSAKWNPWWANYMYGGFKLSDYNMDPREVSYEAAPAAHYWNGGIRVNKSGETNVPGLYAAGEVQGGTMGANRLSGNAVTEAVVFGAVAGGSAAKYVKDMKQPDIDKEQVKYYYENLHAPLNRNNGANVVEVRRKIQEMAMKYAGPVREEEGLKILLENIEKIKKNDIPNLSCSAKGKIYNREWFQCLEADAMIKTLEVVARASLMREESRGAMYRSDFPYTDNENWLKNIIATYKDDKVALETRDIKTSRVDLPEKQKIPYMVPEWEWAQKGGLSTKEDE